MNVQPLIPLEICEEIIDLVAFHAQTVGSGGADYGMFYVSEWRFTLIACALVCKAWHPRSLYHLHASVWLSNRDHVVYLYKRCLQNLDFQAVIKHVIVRGPRQPEHGLEPLGPIPHFGTFMAMLARRLPNVKSLRLCRASWTASTLPADSIKYLSVYSSITHTRLRDVSFSTASQFASLIKALPNLEYISCTDVHCQQKQLIKPFPRPAVDRPVRELVVFNVDDALVDVLIKLGAVAPAVEKLSHHDWLSMTEPNVSRQCQWLLNAHDNLRDVEIIDPNESRIDLSRHSQLATLSIAISHRPYPDISRVYTILSTIKSDTLVQAHLCFDHSLKTDDNLDDHPNDHPGLWAQTLLDRLENSDALSRMDELLSRPNFANIPRGGIRFEIKMSTARNTCAVELTQSEEFWEQLLAQKMPRSTGRGILDCVLTSD